MEIVSKIGIHCMGDRRTGYGEFLHTIQRAGRMIPLVKVRDNFGAIDEPLALWPNVVTIGAYTEWDDADYSPERAFARIMQASLHNPRIKYWEYFNERNGDYARQTDLYITLLPRLADYGIGLCMFNCASGTPHYPEEDPAPYREIARACAFAASRGYKAILGLHEYVSEGGTIARYKILANYLVQRGSLLPIAITEFGCETNPGDGAYLSLVRIADQAYMGDDRLIGAALWTLGGGGWAGSNYSNMLPLLGEYIACVEAQEALPPPPPVPATLEQRVTDLEHRVELLEEAM